MLALPKVTPKWPERNGTKMIVKKYFEKVSGAQMVPDFPKPRCKELSREIKKYAKSLDLSHFVEMPINTYKTF